jgi:hypothetical protein
MYEILLRSDLGTTKELCQTNKKNLKICNNVFWKNKIIYQYPWVQINKLNNDNYLFLYTQLLEADKKSNELILTQRLIYLEYNDSIDTYIIIELKNNNLHYLPEELSKITINNELIEQEFYLSTLLINNL